MLNLYQGCQHPKNEFLTLSILIRIFGQLPIRNNKPVNGNHQNNQLAIHRVLLPVWGVLFRSGHLAIVL